MKKLILAFVVLLFASRLAAQDSSATGTMLTLKQCIETAIKNNIDVKRNEFAAEGDKVSLQQAKGQLLPFLNGNVVHGSNQGRNINPYTNTYINQSVSFANYGLDGTINIFNGLSVQNTIKQYALNYEAGKMDLQQQRDNVTISVILAYLSVLSNQDLLTLSNQQADVSRKQADRLEILNKEGATAPSNYFDIKGQLATDELNIINNKNALETSKITLAQLMNVAYSEDVVLERIYDTITPVLYEGAADDIYVQAANKLATVKAASLHSRSAVAALKAARGLQYPRLYVNGGVGTNYSSTGTLQELISTSNVATDNYVTVDDKQVAVYAPSPVFKNNKITYGDQWKNNFNSYVNLTVSIPLLNGLETRSRIRQASIAAKQSSFEEETIKVQLKQNVDQAFVNMKTAFASYETVDQQVKDFSESFREAEIKFEEGVYTSVEYLLVKKNVDNARTNLISSKYNFILRSKILDYYQSKPLW